MPRIVSPGPGACVCCAARTTYGSWHRKLEGNESRLNEAKTGVHRFTKSTEDEISITRLLHGRARWRRQTRGDNEDGQGQPGKSLHTSVSDCTHCTIVQVTYAIRTCTCHGHVNMHAYQTCVQNVLLCVDPCVCSMGALLNHPSKAISSARDAEVAQGKDTPGPGRCSPSSAHSQPASPRYSMGRVATAPLSPRYTMGEASTARARAYAGPHPTSTNRGHNSNVGPGSYSPEAKTTKTTSPAFSLGSRAGADRRDATMVIGKDSPANHYRPGSKAAWRLGPSYRCASTCLPCVYAHVYAHMHMHMHVWAWTP